MAIVTVAALLDALHSHHLLLAEQAGELPQLRAGFRDARALAGELVRRGWLTSFQVEALLRGAGTELVLGPYRLLDKLGQGAMGKVYKARHVRMNRVVALKLIDGESLTLPNAVQRFEREVRAAAALQHPNIVLAYDADQAGKAHFLAMEFVEGTDLAQLVKQRGPLPVSEACDYVRQAALGLQHAHEKGLVHRDIKPSNLMLAILPDRVCVKILDFGLARFASEAGAAGRLTQVGRIVGTVDYLAPEQAEDARSADIRADIYSLGCTLFFLLTGKPPFPGADMVERLGARLLGEAPLLSSVRRDVPASLEDKVRQMLARDPRARYQTPAEVAAALEPFVVVKRPRPSPPPDAVTPSPRAPVARLAPEPVLMGLPVLEPAPRQRGGPERRPRQPGNWHLWLVTAGLGLICVVAVTVFYRPELLRRSSFVPTREAPRERPRLDAVPPLRLLAGQAQTIEVGLDRRGNDGSPEVRVEGLPAGVSATFLGAGPEEKTTARLTVSAQPDVPEGESAIRIVASLGGASVETTARLFVEGMVREVRKFGNADLGSTTWIQFMPDGKQVLASTLDRGTFLWEAETGKEVRRYDLGTRPVFGQLSPDGKRLLTSGTDGLRLWDMQTGTELRRLRNPASMLQFVLAGRQAWSSAFEAQPTRRMVVQLWELESGREVRRLDLPAATTFIQRPLAFSPDGARAVVVSQAGPALWDLYASRELRRLEGHTAAVLVAAFSPDGRRCLTGSTNPEHVLRLWDVDSGQQVRAFVGSAGAISSVTFSPDGRRALSSGGDGPVRLWDVESGFQLRQFEVPGSRAFRLVYAPDGRSVLSRHADNSIRLWSLPRGSYPAPEAGQVSRVVLPTCAYPTGHVWRYTTTSPPSGWEQTTFDDSAWASGPGGFGTPGTIGLPAVRTPWTTTDIWLRTRIRVPDQPDATVVCRYFQDDDIDVYVNGNLLFQRIGWVSGYQQQVLQPKQRALFQEGENVVAVHCRNGPTTPGTVNPCGVDIGFDWVTHD